MLARLEPQQHQSVSAKHPACELRWKCTVWWWARQLAVWHCGRCTHKMPPWLSVWFTTYISQRANQQPSYALWHINGALCILSWPFPFVDVAIRTLCWHLHFMCTPFGWLQTARMWWSKQCEETFDHAQWGKVKLNCWHFAPLGWLHSERAALCLSDTLSPYCLRIGTDGGRADQAD